MALTPSNMLALGSTAPDFTLMNVVSQKMTSFNDCATDKGLVVMFICNHCPYVVHLQETIARVAKEYQEKGLGFVAICSNDADNYPDDAPAKLAEQAERLGFSFPYLYDEDQSVAQAYQAACTPDFYLFDGNKQCVYRGRFDEATPGNQVPVTGEALRAAMDALLAGQSIPDDQQPSIGCNIKWK